MAKPLESFEYQAPYGSHELNQFQRRAVDETHDSRDVATAEEMYSDAVNNVSSSIRQLVDSEMNATSDKLFMDDFILGAHNSMTELAIVLHNCKIPLCRILEA